MFRFGLPLLLLIIQGILFTVTWQHLRHHQPDRRWLRVSVAALFILFNSVLILSALFRVRFFDFHGLPFYTVVLPFFVWQIATFTIGLVLLIVFVIRLPFKVAVFVARLLPPVRKRIDRWHSSSEYHSFDASRRTFLRRSAYTLAAASIGGTAYGAITGRTDCDVNTKEFILKNLPPSLDGFSIALLSDIHSGAFMSREEMSRYAAMANGLRPDLIVVPGDFVTGLTEEVYPFTEAFAELRAPHGVYGSTGNHEYYTRDPELVIREVNDSGIRILSNDRVTIEKNGASFTLIGIDDTGSYAAALGKFDAATKNLQTHSAQVLLCHRPYYFQHLADRGVDLVLSGHTHGGQIRLARFGSTVITPAALVSPYVSGAYYYKDAALYVSRGIGTVAVPFRINCPPEITRIVLRSAASQTGRDRQP